MVPHYVPLVVSTAACIVTASPRLITRDSIASTRRNIGLMALFLFLSVTFMLLAISKSPVATCFSQLLNYRRVPSRQVPGQYRCRQGRRCTRRRHCPHRLLRRPRRAPHPGRELVHPPPRQRLEAGAGGLSRFASSMLVPASRAALAVSINSTPQCTLSCTVSGYYRMLRSPIVPPVSLSRCYVSVVAPRYNGSLSPQLALSCASPCPPV